MKTLHWWLPLASAVMLIAGVGAPNSDVRIDWLLLGSELGIGSHNRPFLIVTGLAWLVASLVGMRDLARHPRALAFYSLAFAGNVVATLSQDLLSFYMGFATLGLAAYGMIADDRSPERRRAGRIYLTLTIGAELLLFVAMVWLFDAAGSSHLPVDIATNVPFWVASCVILGFGVKIGLLPVHVTLPLAYGAAPLAGGIALAGSALNAGILGLTLWLPGDATSDGAAWLLIILGLAGYVYAVGVGAVQSSPRVLLGYSSVSQASLIAVLIGIGLLEPAQSPVMMAAVGLTMTHHALAKTALFVGCGIRPRGAVPRSIWSFGLVIAALALAGAPLTSGYTAKLALENAVASTAALRGLGSWLWVSGLLTTLLMARLAWLVRQRPPPTGSRLATLGLGLAIAALLAFTTLAATSTSWPLAATFGAGLPIAAAVAVAAGWARFGARAALLPRGSAIPPGDIAIPVARGIARIGGYLAALWSPHDERRSAGPESPPARREAHAALDLPWPTAAGLVLGTLALLAYVLILTQ